MMVGNPRRVALALVFALLALPVARGSIPSGNEFALYYTEAKTQPVRKQVLDDALGKQHFFRFLRIISLHEGETNGYPFVALTTVEPSSQMTVSFTAVKSMSLAVLKDAPVSAVGDALAVTGVVKSVDPARRLIELGPVIVRYKDRLAPKIGKEMLAERLNSGIVYSFTGGKEAVNVSKRDEDLIQYEDKILAERGKDGWAQFLLDEIAKRDKVEKARRDNLGIYRKVTAPSAAGSAAPSQGIITDDEE